jgi:integrase
VKMASIYKQRSTWRVRIRRKGALPISKQFNSKIDASKWARKVERLVELGKYEDTTEAGMTTLAEALYRYKVEKTADKKGMSEESYRIGKLMRYDIAKVSLAELTAGKLTKFRKALALETSNSNANRYVSLICTCLKTALNEWEIYIPTNPCDKVGQLPEPAPKEDRITPEQEARIMASARESRNIYLPCIITIGFELGMRRGEIVKLRWEWIKGDTIVIPDTKNGTTRTVPLTDRINAEFDKLQRQDIGRIFGNMKSFRDAWEHCLKRAGVQTNFHRLRHEACSRLDEKGFTIPQICSISGHKSWESLKRYTHIKPETLREKLNAR